MALDPNLLTLNLNKKLPLAPQIDDATVGLGDEPQNDELETQLELEFLQGLAQEP